MKWSKVENLHVQKETVMKSLPDEKMPQDDDDESITDDEELEEDLLNWRTKKAWNV